MSTTGGGGRRRWQRGQLSLCRAQGRCPHSPPSLLPGALATREERSPPWQRALGGKLRHAAGRPRPGVRPGPTSEGRGGAAGSDAPRAAAGLRAGGREAAAAAAAGAAAEGGREREGAGGGGRGKGRPGTSPFITRPLLGSRAACSSALPVSPPRPSAPGPGSAGEPPGSSSGTASHPPPSTPPLAAPRSPAEAAPSEEEEQGTAAGPGSGARAAAASAAARPGPMQRDAPPRASAPPPRLPAPPIGAANSSGGGGGGGSGGGGGASAAPAPPGLPGTTSPRGPGGGRRPEEAGSAPRGRKWPWRRKWRGRGGAWSVAGPGAAAAAAAAGGGGGGALEAAMAKQYDSVECPFCDEVSKYEKLAKIGQGTFGEVFKAKHRQTGQKVALKKVLMENEKEGFPITALREIKILQLLKHENVVNLIEICRTKASPYNRCKGSIYLVFDFCEHDLAGLLSNVLVKFTLSEIKRVMQMLLNGLYYIHRNKILHRDMKAANVLITRDGVLKLADFGLARAFSLAKNSQPNRYTNRVVTLWYRPPELLLGERDYGPPIDLWGAGCIMAEMWTRSPIMQGNTEQHQLALISQLCGSITPEVWPNVDKYELFEKLELVKGQKRKVKDRLKAYVRDPYALDLIDKLLVLDPAQRIDSDDALNHDFFWSDPMPSDLKGMLSTHLTSMFEYLAPPRRKGSQITQQSTNQSRNPATTNQTEFERVF